MSDPCNPPDGITDDKRNYLQSLCSCKTAANALAKDVDERVRQSQAWSVQHQQWIKDMDDWKSVPPKGKYANYANYNSNQTFMSDHCFDRPSPGKCSARVGRSSYTDGYCAQEATAKGKPFASEYIDTNTSRSSCGGGFWDGCAGNRGQNVSCGRDPDKLAKWKEDYNNAIPLDTARPTDNSSDTIQCCSNYMNLGADAQSNAQTCLNSIEKQTETKLNQPDDNGSGTGSGSSGSAASILPWVLSILLICVCFCGAGSLIMLMSGGSDASS